MKFSPKVCPSVQWGLKQEPSDSENSTLTQLASTQTCIFYTDFVEACICDTYFVNICLLR